MKISEEVKWDFRGRAVCKKSFRFVFFNWFQCGSDHLFSVNSCFLMAHISCINYKQLLWEK